MENNPDNVEDTKQVVYHEQNMTITRQPLVGGGGVYEAGKAADLEAGPQDTPQGVSGIVVRQAVRPSPTNAQTTVQKPVTTQQTQRQETRLSAPAADG